MSVNYLPAPIPGDPGRDQNALAAPQPWSLPSWGAGAESEDAGIPWGRYLAALRRYKWMILVVAVLGTLLGIGITRFMAPEYQVTGTIWISQTDPRPTNTGPVRGDELLG